MEFSIWKTNLLQRPLQNGAPRDSAPPRYMVSILGAHSVAVVLDLDKFEKLFPEIGLEAIPEAPATGTIEIQARLK